MRRRDSLAHAGPYRGFLPRLPVERAPNGLLAILLEWDGRWRMRRSLERLDDHLLRDIGLTRAEALDEAARPFWCD